jgi:hypothetical protein
VSTWQKTTLFSNVYKSFNPAKPTERALEAPLSQSASSTGSSSQSQFTQECSETSSSDDQPFLPTAVWSKRDSEGNVVNKSTVDDAILR